MAVTGLPSPPPVSARVLDTTVHTATVVVCTLGMHRSGTSVVARLLNLLGVHLGSEALLMAPQPDNPKGFWEYDPFVRINDAVLGAFGGHWHTPPAWPDGWTNEPHLDAYKTLAVDWIAKDLATAPCWGWKDPRTCLTLPFWQSIVGPMRYVIVTRSPAEVVASLATRNEFTAAEAERLWLAHVASTLRDTAGQPCLFVFCDDLCTRPETEVRRLAAFIGAPARAEDPAIKAAIADYLDDALWHHRVPVDAMAADTLLSFPSKALYLAMRSLAHDAVPTTEPHVGQPAAAVHRAVAQLASQALGIAAAREARAAESMATLTADVDRWRAAAAALSTERASLVAHRDALTGELSAVTARCAAAAAELAAARATLDAVHGSTAWRAVTTARKLVVRALPPGSVGGRALAAGLARFRGTPARVD